MIELHTTKQDAAIQHLKFKELIVHLCFQYEPQLPGGAAENIARPHRDHLG